MPKMGMARKITIAKIKLFVNPFWTVPSQKYLPLTLRLQSLQLRQEASYKQQRDFEINQSKKFMVLLSNQKQPSCKKRCGPQKGHGEKRCEIQGGGQEMAVMVG